MTSTGVDDVMERTTRRPDEWQLVGVATADTGVAASKVGVASSSRDDALFTALGVALGVVVVAMTMIIVVCAWRQRQQRRLLGIIGLLRSEQLLFPCLSLSLAYLKQP